MTSDTVTDTCTNQPLEAIPVWRHVGSVMEKASSEKLGYRRELVSDPPDMYGVDILSCPYHELAKQLDDEKAVLCICHMDKEYSQGFRHIRYDRNSAVSLLSRGRIQTERTILDAAFCVDMGLLKGCYSRVFPKAVARVRDGKYVPGFLIDLFMGKGNRSMTKMIYPGITVETCRNACRDVYSYRISDELRNTSSTVEFWRGSREPYPEKGAALLKKVLPSMTERVFPNMGHCQFLHEHPEEYAALLDQTMRTQ